MESGAPGSARSDSAGPISMRCWRNTFRTGWGGNGQHPVEVGELAGELAGESACPTRLQALVHQGAFTPAEGAAKPPLRGALLAGASSGAELAERLRAVQKAAEAGRIPEIAAPAGADLRAPERISIDYANAAELADKCAKALKALGSNRPAAWKALRAQGIFRGHGPAPKVAFLYRSEERRVGKECRSRWS